MLTRIEQTYSDALEFADYRARLINHRGIFNDHYEALSFVPQDESSKSSMTDVRILVLSEDYCIDSVLNVPLIARLVEASPKAELRLARRDEHLDIAASFPARGGVSRLPTVIMLDRNMRLLGSWSERSRQDHEWMAEFVKQDPIPEMVFESGRPIPVLAAWMARRFAAQQPFFLEQSWKSVRDELIVLLDRDAAMMKVL